MPWVGFEPTIPAFERAKTVHALHCATTMIGLHIQIRKQILVEHLWKLHIMEYQTTIILKLSSLLSLFC
jgi:hypothetical protein